MLVVQLLLIFVAVSPFFLIWIVSEIYEWKRVRIIANILNMFILLFIVISVGGGFAGMSGGRAITEFLWSQMMIQIKKEIQKDNTHNLPDAIDGYLETYRKTHEVRYAIGAFSEKLKKHSQEDNLPRPRPSVARPAEDENSDDQNKEN